MWNVSSIAGSSQSITLPPVGQKLTSDAPFALGGTASSGLAVEYAVVSPAGVATVASSTVTLSGVAGVGTIKASQPGNATYDAAPDVYVSFPVSAAGEVYQQVSQGALFTLAVKPDATLWAWGFNGNLQLGDGTTYH